MQGAFPARARRTPLSPGRPEFGAAPRSAHEGKSPPSAGDIPEVSPDLLGVGGVGTISTYLRNASIALSRYPRL